MRRGMGRGMYEGALSDSGGQEEVIMHEGKKLIRVKDEGTDEEFLMDLNNHDIYNTQFKLIGNMADD